MYYGQIGLNNTYKVYPAAQTLAGAFTAVGLTDNGVAVGSTLGAIGILTAETESVAAGDDVNVVLSGTALWKTAESISAGDGLGSDSDGLAVKANSNAFAQALEGGAAGEVIPVIIR